jgi:hypothetical protein
MAFSAHDVLAAPVERGFIVQYEEPTMSGCPPATQLKPTSSPTLCVEGLGNHTTQQTCNTTKNQLFELVPVAPAGSNLFQLKSRTTHLCLRVGLTEGDATLETHCANASAGGGGAQDQIFRIGPSPSKLQSNIGAGGLCLEISGDLAVAGSSVQAGACHGGSNQLFSYGLDSGGNCPLNDLGGTKIFVHTTGTGQPEEVHTIPPSSNLGGGTISKPICVKVPDDTLTQSIEVQALAFDVVGNESPRTEKIVLPVQGGKGCSWLNPDRPEPPINLRFIY